MIFSFSLSLPSDMFLFFTVFISDDLKFRDDVAFLISCHLPFDQSKDKGEVKNKDEMAFDSPCM